MIDRVRLVKNMIEGGYLTYDQVKEMTGNGELSVLELSVLRSVLNHKEYKKMKTTLRGGFTELHLYPNQFLKGCFYSYNNNLNVKCYFEAKLIEDMAFKNFGMCEITGHFDNLTDEPDNDVWFVLDEIKAFTKEEIEELK